LRAAMEWLAERTARNPLSLLGSGLSAFGQ
jgi:hypothetical protein